MILQVGRAGSLRRPFPFLGFSSLSVIRHSEVGPWPPASASVMNPYASHPWPVEGVTPNPDVELLNSLTLTPSRSWEPAGHLLAILGVGSICNCYATPSSPGVIKLVQPVLLGQTGYLLCQLRLPSHRLFICPRYSRLPFKTKERVLHIRHYLPALSAYMEDSHWGKLGLCEVGGVDCGGDLVFSEYLNKYWLSNSREVLGTVNIPVNETKVLELVDF